MAVNCVGYFRRSARRAWRNGSTISGLGAFGGYNPGERRLGIITRWIEVGDPDSWDERCPMNLVKGDVDGSGSVKSRFSLV